MRSSAILLAFAVLPQLSSCGWSAAAFQLRGELAGESLETSVDSPIARYYVDAYLTGRRHNKSWDDALDAIHRDLGENVPSTEQLKVWTRSHSADLAALVFAHQVLRQSRDGALLRVFREELVTVQASHRAGNLESVRIDPDALILFVPGWLYKADTTTGADFARFRALLSRHGASVSLVETGQNLAVEDNARLIRRSYSPRWALGEGYCRRERQ